MISEKLKPYIECYGAELPLKYSHGDEVMVGGKIVSIFELGNIIGDLLDQRDPKDSLGEEGIYITLDDGIQPFQVVLHRDIYRFYKGKYNLKIGDVIVVKGKLAFLDTTHREVEKGKIIEQNNHDEQGQFRVLAWDVKLIPDL